VYITHRQTDARKILPCRYVGSHDTVKFAEVGYRQQSTSMYAARQHRGHVYTGVFVNSAGVVIGQVKLSASKASYTRADKHANTIDLSVNNWTCDHIITFDGQALTHAQVGGVV